MKKLGPQHISSLMSRKKSSIFIFHTLLSAKFWDPISPDNMSMHWDLIADCCLQFWCPHGISFSWASIKDVKHSLLSCYTLCPIFFLLLLGVGGWGRGIVHLSFHLSIHMWTESCPLCIFQNTGQIHLMFTRLINQLQEVCVACWIF